MSHPRLHARVRPDKPALVMTDGSRGLTYAELEERANRGAHLLRGLGVGRGDTVAFWLPNCAELFEVYWAAQRCGAYVTPIATTLTGGEADYILRNSQAKVLVAAPELPGFAALAPHGELAVFSREAWSQELDRQPATPIADESPGFHMVYSSGTTGKPKGVRLPLPDGGVTDPHQIAALLEGRYGLGPGDVYLSPAPLYHTAPLAYTTSCHRLGATVVQMPKFEPEGALAAIERHKVTIVQMVPTMFSRLLKLPEAVRLAHDLSSLRLVIHAAAPCPVPVKHAMIAWLGPILYEYYGGSEGNGSTGITSEEWLRKPGSVGRATWGTLHVCNDAGDELAPGETGLIYFEGGWNFQYLGDEDKTRDSRNPKHPNWSALGDIGHVDEDGYLFLTDRKSYMIISGGVNIYPQEVENLLITHPRVADAAVIGVPHPEFGEEVKAVVQPLDPADATPEFAAELLTFCREQLSPIKCPRSVDFDPALPRQENGKLYKRIIRERYWLPA
ncbi:acyl-CoA synthetase [Novosphingobium sp. KCTC 2891]|uniref:acyl-CoA synthetase n=1 Tax=Novosphingobium sp. KCTC 2891 TaxID=2989730 RepID=UPI00222394C4|nr:acyl-CoA synthetase [Novosphingobium sp. KCTC 2891]MCW1383670.1 acyl-CoA synthetase [Novosphingobium sp. KCTC 2891]